jgi:DNA (cytosine-5)-methyltransferase 1|nr:MAG TPA: Cytosine specific methyltransferase [Caudoviricetes sp.]
MTFIDLFSGIGGFRRGMEMAGHKCIGFCEYDKFAVASYTAMHLMTDEERKYIDTIPFRGRVKEANKEEYRHGEWYADDITKLRADDIPTADCWCFGFPCQDISVAGKQAGLDGNRSGLFHTVIKLLEDTKKENRPSYLFIENVKNLLSVNRGFDFLTVLAELDEVGYDAEWQVLNSADYVPQNRERIFIIGHLRGRSGRKVFPIERADRKNSVSIIGHRDGYRRNSQTYSSEGITEALDTGTGGGRGFNVMLPCFCDMSYKAGQRLSETACAIQARYNKGVSNRHGEVSGVAIPVLTPDRVDKRQNGRRMKENGEDMFTLTGQDRHGVMVKLPNGVYAYAVWYEKYRCYIAIRKLTPKECFRLQGWEDKYFDRAAIVNSDSQLYKQAGNGVTVPVIYEIAKRMEKELEKATEGLR